MKAYYRVFYWLYRLSLNSNAFRDDKPVSAFVSVILISSIVVMDFAIVETTLKYFGINIRQFYGDTGFYIISGCILVTTIVFLHKRKYLEIEGTFKDEDRKLIKDVLCAIYSLISWFGVPTLGLFFGNPWIK